MTDSWSEAAAVAVRPDGGMRAPLADKPEIEITGGPGRVTRTALHELWLYREVLWAFLVRSVKITYKQAAFGIGWAILRPVISALLLTVVFSHLTKVGSEGAPYFLFALAGQSAWTFFSGSAGSAADSLVSTMPLLRKVYFPREVVPLATIGAGLVDLLPQLGTLFVAAALYGYYPKATWIVLPLAFVLLLLVTAALGVALSSLNVYYRDVRYGLPFVLQMGMFLTPVIYSLSKVPDRWRTIYTILNPVAAVIDTTRRAVLHDKWPHFAVLAGAYGSAFVLFGLGFVLFKRLEPGFADRG